MKKSEKEFKTFAQLYKELENKENFYFEEERTIRKKHKDEIALFDENFYSAKKSLVAEIQTLEKEVKTEIKKLFKGIQIIDKDINFCASNLKIGDYFSMENGSIFTKNLDEKTINALIEIYKKYLVE